MNFTNLNWLAAGEIYSQEATIAFARAPQTAISKQHFLLLSGARDYGIIIVDLRIGVVVLQQTEHRSQTVGVVANEHCIFVVTPSKVFVYCLDEKDASVRLLPMPTIVAPSSSSKMFTDVSVLDASTSTLYIKMSDGTCYEIYAIKYNDALYSLIHTGVESHAKAITHIFTMDAQVLGVQGHIGVICDLHTPARTLMKIHDRVRSITYNGVYLVTTQCDSQSVVVWSPDCNRNDQYEISLRQLFPNGQNAVVQFHQKQLVVVHGCSSLMHVFEVTGDNEPPSEVIRIMRENALHAHIERTICRRIDSVETQTPQQIASTFIGEIGDSCPFENIFELELEVPPAPTKKSRLSIFDTKKEPSSFFDLLDPYFQSLDLFAIN